MLAVVVAGDSRSERLVRPDSQRLEDPAGSEVTFVEFLDFECEACGAAYVFFDFAEDLDLDMDRFRQVYDDPGTIARVRRDKADGETLGVTATPTFLLNGDKVEVSSFDQIDAALAAS